MAHRATHMLTLGLSWLIICAAGCSEKPPPNATVVDFHREVWPILETRCLRCHDAAQPGGGLRLDDRTFALNGGVSGKRLNEQPTAVNELLRRVRSTDPAERMPREGGRLSDSEIQTLERWVEAGTSWPEVRPSSGWRELSTRYVDDLWKRLLVVGGEIKIHLLLLFSLVIGAGERIRRIQPDSRTAWTSGWRQLIWRFSQRVSLSVWLSGLLLFVLWDLLEFSTRQALLIAGSERDLLSLTKQRRGIVDRPSDAKPMPLRPRAVLPFGGTYYRGNDERNPQLFNGGYYRTANMIVTLVDSQGRTVQPGDEVMEPKLAIRLEIQRAPGATPTLYTDELFGEVLLTQRTSAQDELSRPEQPARMEVLESGERWAATYSLGDVVDQPAASTDGVIYVYSNTKPAGELANGLIQYGIVYSLRFRDRRLQSNSELWMGPVLLPGNFQPIEPGKITLPEWFDAHPIPEIQGENSTDPKLLGIPQHLPNAPKNSDADLTPSARRS